ncbi:hypothetical protein LDENG_00250150, partial [Lucifuga dentata]
NKHTEDELVSEKGNASSSLHHLEVVQFCTSQQGPNQYGVTFVGAAATESSSFSLEKNKTKKKQIKIENRPSV